MFAEQESSEAAEFLEMISKMPEQLTLYSARLKHRRNEVAKILQARLEGEARARMEGEEIGEARG